MTSISADHVKNYAATPIKDSKGTKQDRITFANLDLANTKLLAVAIKSKEWPGNKPPTLHFWEKWRFCLLKIKQSDGTECYVKVNRNSIAKRFGINKAFFEGDVTDFVNTQLKNKFTPEPSLPGSEKSLS